MGKRMSDKTKAKLKLGTGTGANYKPYLRVNDMTIGGTRARVIDWITGREVHLMSQAEKIVWFNLRWRDDIIDIREQFPLELCITQKIAESFGIIHPRDAGEDIVMTTDLLLTMTDGTEIAINIKDSKTEIDKRRNKEKALIEKYYWQVHKNIKYYRVCSKDFNKILCKNLELINVYYSDKNVCDQSSYFAHQIMRKKILVDLETEVIHLEKIKEVLEGNYA